MSYREIKKTKSTQNKSIMNDVVTLAPEIYSSSDYSNPSSTGGNRQLKKKHNTNNSTFMITNALLYSIFVLFLSDSFFVNGILYSFLYMQ